MRICFLDYTNFKYSFEDKYTPKLRGAETVLINLSSNLKPEEIARKALKVASDICVFTNNNVTLEKL